MGKYEEGLALVEERCGNGKDNVIALSTIAITPGESGAPRPYTRDVDAYYEDGVFYISTNGVSTKMKQIEKNPEVAFAVCFGWFSGNAIGENLGWVMEPKNAAIRSKMREVFKEWYEMANDESDKNSVILALKITRATVIKDHHAVVYHMDFINKAETEEGRIR